MKPEEKRHLKRFWLGKGLLLTSVLATLGITIVTVPVLKSQYAIVQEAKVQEEIKAFPDSLFKNLQSTDPVIFSCAISALRKYAQEDKTILKFLADRKLLAWDLSQMQCGIAWHMQILRKKTEVPSLLEHMRDHRSPSRFEAFRALKKLSPSGQLAQSSQATASSLLIIEICLFLVTILVGGSGLIFFIRIRNPYPLSWSGHLLLPEEMMAELIALKRRRQKQNLPQWKLNLELTTEVLSLLWAIHVQVRLQNLQLPPSKKRNID